MDNSSQIKPQAQTFRFIFSDNFKEELSRFSQINQFTERKTFKENWKQWLEENSELINQELERLKTLDYDGDIENKMFTSARYYYRKKTIDQEPNKKTNKPRKKYVSLSKEFLNKIDQFILKSLNTQDYKPKNTFEQFCTEKENHDIIKETIKAIKQQDPDVELSEIEKKIKKTYKNRYRIITK